MDLLTSSMPWLFAFVAMPAALYLTVIVGLVALQRRFIYRPMPGHALPADAGAPWMRTVHQDGRLLGWFVAPPTAGAPVLVFFHGNRGTLSRVAGKVAPWRDLGIGIFAATYRGFEGNPGKPNEAGLYADGRAVLDWLEGAGIAGHRLILYGESLGSGVAAQLALERPVRAVVLEAPYASVADIAADRYPWTPARRLVRDRFETLAKIGRISAPVLILHGDADQTIPVHHAYRLAAAAPSAQLVVVPGANHLDLYDRGASSVFQSFITTVKSEGST